MLCQDVSAREYKRKLFHNLGAAPTRGQARWGFGANGSRFTLQIPPLGLFIAPKITHHVFNGDFIGFIGIAEL